MLGTGIKHIVQVYAFTSLQKIQLSNFIGLGSVVS